MAWPADSTVRIRMLGRGSSVQWPAIGAVTLLGQDLPLNWSVSEEALVVNLQDAVPTGRPMTLKLCQ
ncbi:MAG: hypothetical protein R2932_21775 [Caldilineaceae bacterium]